MNHDPNPALPIGVLHPSTLQTFLTRGRIRDPIPAPTKCPPLPDQRTDCSRKNKTPSNYRLMEPRIHSSFDDLEWAMEAKMKHKIRNCENGDPASLSTGLALPMPHLSQILTS